MSEVETEKNTSADSRMNESSPEDNTAGKESTQKTEPKSKQNIHHGGPAIGNEYVAWKQNIHYHGTTSNLRLFDYTSMARPIPLEEQEQHVREYLYDPTEIDSLLKALIEFNMLVIKGESGFGKLALARFLAQKTLEIRGGGLNETVLVEPLGSIVRIDVHKETEKRGKRVWIFENALVHGNSDIREFLEKLHEHSLHKLAERQIYLIFTAGASLPFKLDASSRQSRFFFDVPTLGRERLIKGFDLCLTRIRRICRLTREQRDDIAIRARSIPRIFRFVEEYLDSVEQGSLTIDEALDRLQDLNHWFLFDLSEDFEAWYLTFIAVLAQTDGGGVPWMEVQELRRVLLETVRKRLGEPRRHETYYHKDRIADSHFLEKAKCRIVRDPDIRRDILTFLEADYAERLWEVLLTQSRDLLTFLFPALVKQMETENWTLRMNVARIIGRLGEMDPEIIVFSLLKDWSRSEDYSKNCDVGYVLEGALSSRDGYYKRLFLEQIERLGKSDNQYCVGTAIIAYKQISWIDFAFCMEKLKEIAESRFSDNLLEIQDILKEKHRSGNEEAKYSEDLWMVLYHRAYREMLDEGQNKLLESLGYLLYLFQYCITEICITLDPISVFDELNRWLDGETGFRALVLLIFLSKEGMADGLRQAPVEYRCGDKDSEADFCLINKLVSALLSEDDAPRRTAYFLEKVYDTLKRDEQLSSTFANPLRRLFFDRLFDWLKDTADFPPGLKAMEDLFVYLRKSENRELADEILEKLKNHPVIYKKENGLVSFSMRVRSLAI